MSLTNLLIPTYRQMLRTLVGLLDKAQQQMPERAEALLSARLSADMYPLATQLRFAAFQARDAVFKLRGDAAPPSSIEVPAEGRNAGDTPGSIADARNRISQTISFLDGVPPDALDASDGLPITIEVPGGIVFDLTGEQYVRDWALPQFYFHVITAYAILRYQGVEIGKADYVPHMSAYLRPGSIPGT